MAADDPVDVEAISEVSRDDMDGGVTSGSHTFKRKHGGEVS
jgi:hypothetical protein